MYRANLHKDKKGGSLINMTPISSGPLPAEAVMCVVIRKIQGGYRPIVPSLIVSAHKQRISINIHFG